MNDHQYVLIQDEDCHWYVCPADKQDDASAYFETVDRYWSDVNSKGGPPPEPDWLKAVGGAPSLVKFTGYVIE